MIVITGATGIIGRPLVGVLAGEGIGVRAVTRTPRAADLPARVEVVDGDPSKPETIARPLVGTTALFLHPRAVGDAAGDLVALAGELGVRRVVALVAANVDDDVADQPSRYRGDRNKEAEDAAADSGLEWVSLRPSSFAVNTLFAWGDQISTGDLVRYVCAAFQESPIHELDLAVVAARALLSDDLLGQRLELTGPQSLSTRRWPPSSAGRCVTRRSLRRLPNGMLQHGFPAPFVEPLMARYAAHLGQPQHPRTREVEKILGRPRAPPRNGLPITLRLRHQQAGRRQRMRLTICAATGRTGRHVLEQAIAAGHEVTTVVRNPDLLSARVRVVTADLTTPDPGALESAFNGADAVLSGLGPRNNTEYGTTSTGTRAIVDAMKASDVRRLIVVSVAGISTIPTPGRPNQPKRDPGVGFFMRNVLSPIAKMRLSKHYADVALMEDHLRGSGLDWTSVQLPLLTDKPPTGHYRTAYEQSVRGGFRISRADAAHFMLHVLQRPETIEHSIAIAY